MTTEILTQDKLKSLLDYNQYTGVFVWLVTCGSVKNGDIAGSVFPHQNGKCYFRICISGKNYLSHRLAWLYMTGGYPKNQIDHINGNGCHNWFYNLRDVSELENHRNVRRMKNNTSGLTGVYWDDSRNKWKSSISVSRKHVYLGRFDDYFEACCARRSADYKYGFHQNHGSIRDL